MFALEKNNSYQISRGKTGKNMEKNKKEQVRCRQESWPMQILHMI